MLRSLASNAEDGGTEWTSAVDSVKNDFSILERSYNGPLFERTLLRTDMVIRTAHVYMSEQSFSDDSRTYFQQTVDELTVLRRSAVTAANVHFHSASGHNWPTFMIETGIYSYFNVINLLYCLDHYFMFCRSTRPHGPATSSFAIFMHHHGSGGGIYGRLHTLDHPEPRIITWRVPIEILCNSGNVIMVCFVGDLG